VKRRGKSEWKSVLCFVYVEIFKDVLEEIILLLSLPSTWMKRCRPTVFSKLTRSSSSGKINVQPMW
jgi:hypothetical protein